MVTGSRSPATWPSTLSAEDFIEPGEHFHNQPRMRPEAARGRSEQEASGRAPCSPGAKSQWAAVVTQSPSCARKSAPNGDSLIHTQFNPTS